MNPSYFLTKSKTGREYMPNMAVAYFEFCDVVLVTKNDKYPYYSQLGRPVPREAVIRQKCLCESHATGSTNHTCVHIFLKVFNITELLLSFGLRYEK